MRILASKVGKSPVSRSSLRSLKLGIHLFLAASNSAFVLNPHCRHPYSPERNMRWSWGSLFSELLFRLFLPDTKLQARARLRGGASFSRLYRTTPEGERLHTATRYASRKSQDRERARSQLMTIWLRGLTQRFGGRARVSTFSDSFPT